MTVKKKYITRFIINIVLIAIAMGLSAQSVSAASTDYVLDSDNMGNIPIPWTYRVHHVIGDLGDAGFLNQPEDIFIDNRGLIFVADTGNNRILKMDKEGSILHVFKGPEDRPVSSPNGIYVDKDGDLYIADTKNQRILHLSPEGEYVEEFVRPDSKLLDDDPVFEPVKISIDPLGYIYLIKGKVFMTIDANNKFKGYKGSTKLTFDLRHTIVRMFATDEQKKRLAKREPSPYSNFEITDDGFIYTVSSVEKTSQIKKLNYVGKNIYPEKFYGEISISQKGQYEYPYFVDITVDKNGIISALDQRKGKVYQFDQEGNLLTVFGGLGRYKGVFETPSSLAVDEEGNIYVLDKTSNNIQIFKPTEFIKTIHRAVIHYSNGEYGEAMDHWYGVLKVDESYSLAHEGIAKSLMKAKRWEEALVGYREAGDKTGYSRAFSKYRHASVRKYFGYTILAVAGILFLMIKLIAYLKKISDYTTIEKYNTNIGVPGQMLQMIFQPIDAFDRIKKNRDGIRITNVFLLLFLIVMVRVVYINVIHFPLAGIEPKDANIFLETVRMLVPLLTWVAASYAVTSIVEGETKMGEILMVSLYSFTPYIVLTIPLALLSRIMDEGQRGLYFLGVGIIWIWVITLMFIGVLELNGYTIRKTVGVCVLGIITIAITWGVIVLLFALISQLLEFIKELLLEIKIRFILT